MIFTDSRYASGTLSKSINPTTNKYHLNVVRNFPSEGSRYYYYQWKEKDRADTVAFKTLGSSNYWWRIMDYNPEIIDPFNIPVGAVLRIPLDR